MSAKAKIFQLTLDAALADRQRRDGIRRAGEHASTAWQHVALAAVRTAALRRREFTTDAVLDVLRGSAATTPELRALGPVMRRAQQAGFIEPTDRFVNSDSVSRHRAPKRIWRSKIYPAAAAVSAGTIPVES